MGVEPAEKTVMQRPPHRPDASIWAGGLGRQTGWVGAFIGAVALAIGFSYHEAGNSEWQTMLFTSIAFIQVFQAIGTRSQRESLSTIGWTTNRLMLAIAGVVVSLQLLAIYTPLREFLDLEVLGPWDLALCVGSGAALLVALETAKAIRRRA
jgi:Ca2+-transporting ATPase